MPVNEEAVAAIDRLAAFAVGLDYARLDAAVQSRLQLMLTDLLGVAAAGARTPEMRRLRAGWQTEPGLWPVVGTDTTTSAETAAYLSAAAACCLELDEGNKHAQGHPAVQVVFAALAAVQLSERPVSGAELLTAIAAGYEVAARFGRALSRHKPWHTHGHWGATGAACAAAMIRGCNERQVAAAIDASTALMHVTPWDLVINGHFARNLWVAGANMAGLNAARLAHAELVVNSGATSSTLGSMVGTLDARVLTDGLGDEWLTVGGYTKVHAACSYTHAAVDLIQQLKQEHHATPADITAVRVRTHSLASPLFSGVPHNRISAMFSFPFVVSAAVLNERVDPASMDPENPLFQMAKDFSANVDLAVSPDYDRRLPGERWTGVDLELVNGATISAEQPNPRGDADYYPFDAADVAAKLTDLLGAEDSARIHAVVAELPVSRDAARVLGRLSLNPNQFEGAHDDD